jgi:Pyruvate/2-oxoacid:ferredoxin oxidoreductase delta subunit
LNTTSNSYYTPAHLSVYVDHMWCLQAHMEVQAQLTTEAVQGAQRATRQQHTASNIGQAPAHTYTRLIQQTCTTSWLFHPDNPVYTRTTELHGTPKCFTCLHTPPATRAILTTPGGIHDLHQACLQDPCGICGHTCTLQVSAMWTHMQRTHELVKPHLKTTAGLRHHRQNLKAHAVVAAAQPITSAKPSVLGSGLRRSRRPLLQPAQ